jgi:methylmalonyl-CoA/ethylmalonyl-CoA epimerase
MNASKPAVSQSQGPDKDSAESIASRLSEHIIALQHVGHIVADLDVAIASYCRLYGLAEESVRRIPDQGKDTLTRFAFLDVAGTEFELIEPVSEAFKSLLFGVPSGGGGINHLAWRVRKLDQALAGLAKSGITVGFVTPNGPVNLPDKRMVYLDPATTDGILIELLEFHAYAHA